jgi:uncharacterized protein YciI
MSSMIAAVALIVSAATPGRSEPLASSGPKSVTIQGGETKKETGLYLIRYHPGPKYDAARPLLKQDLRAHAAFVADLVRRKVIIAAGPTLDEPGGLVLLRAPDLSAARGHMSRDPAVAAGIFLGEVTDWQPVFGPDKVFGDPCARLKD